MILLLLGLALAGEAGGLAVGQSGAIGLGGGLGMGSRPLWAAEGTAYAQPAGWAQLRLRILFPTDSGAQPGIDAAARIGYAAPESPAHRDGKPIYAEIDYGFAARIHTWNAPGLGAVVFRLDTHWQGGGGPWWTERGVFGLLGGLSSQILIGEKLRLEAELAAIPFLIPLRLERGEHDLVGEHAVARGTLTLGIGKFGLGAEAALERHVVTEPEAAEEGAARFTGWTELRF